MDPLRDPPTAGVELNTHWRGNICILDMQGEDLGIDLRAIGRVKSEKHAKPTGQPSALDFCWKLKPSSDGCL